MKPQKLIIDPELRDLIPPLTHEEIETLEASIQADGIRDSILRWGEIIIDGHHRYEICHRLGIIFPTSPVEFENRAAAMEWILRNQFGRRNLSPMQRAELALKLKPALAAAAAERMKAGINDPKQKSAGGQVRDELATIAGVSRDTVSKVEKIIASPVVELSRMARGGQVSISAAAAVASLPEPKARAAVAKGTEGVREQARIARNPPRAKGAGESSDPLIAASPPSPSTPVSPESPRQLAAALLRDYPRAFIDELIAELRKSKGSKHAKFSGNQHPDRTDLAKVSIDTRAGR